MALPFGDNVYTKFFTPKEYQVELLETAKESNIIACIGNITTKTFIALKLIQELSISVRRSRTRRFALFVVECNQNTAHYSSAIKHLTDLSIQDLTQSTGILDKTINAQVVMVNSVQARELISNNNISLEEAYLVIIDDCHYSTVKNHHLQKFMGLITSYQHLRIFGMTYPLYTISDLNPGKIEADLNKLQEIMHCRVETASDIVSILRYNCKPVEYLIECDMRPKDNLDSIILEEVADTVSFLRDHRYDPSEIYEGELLEELKTVPDPTEEPLNIINDFMDVLNKMGAWCANKAALSSLFLIEKLKLKTPYERHYLLLCVVSSLMLRIRTIFENHFAKFSEKDQVYNFVSPKVSRLVGILSQYKPSKRIVLENATAEGSQAGESPSSVEEKKTETPEAETKVVPGTESTESAPLTICDSYIKYKNDKANRWKNKRKFQHKPHQTRPKSLVDESETVCCIIFVKSRLIATVIHYLLSDLKKFDNDNFWWLSPQFTTEKTADPEKEPRDAEIQHRNLEDVLRKFRTRECNILIGTSMLEEGIDLPKCNLVIGFDPPNSFRSFIFSKSKASANNANFFLMYELPEKDIFVNDLAKYYEIEQLLLKRCVNKVEKEAELWEADCYNKAVLPYFPPSTTEEESVYVSLENAIACINKYCAKLPSDSFTRLTPMWTTKKLNFDNRLMYVTSLRLPINSPFKKEIYGHPMPTEILSKRITALETCRQLNQTGELDNNLQPIGKESFHLLFSAEEVITDEADQQLPPNAENTDPRPGTNKRRQYYQRKIASCLTDCRPLPNTQLYLYSINMVLSCPLPEEQNTRGRKIHPPEESPKGFGILLTKKIPKVCPFPIFTRCGEVIVSLELINKSLRLTEEELEKMATFLNYTFTKVLRLNKYFMLFDTFESPCTYFIVPTMTVSDDSEIVIDWEFLDEINSRREEELKVIPDEQRQFFRFCKDFYTDAVIMPWYRNQDFPQHFYVAEICNSLTPKSKFPGVEYKTFEEYYFRKYQLVVQNVDQPLLDVDHTSARLNFLTPRYVNRKGVALPTCSEATKKAKRESLEQKQILVPELCQIHIFPASLWRKAVALPCILYRLNCLLIAEEIRNKVSKEINLGLNTVPEDFHWPYLNFGWTLADVIKRTRELKELKAQKENAKLPLRLTEVEDETEDPKEEASNDIDGQKNAATEAAGKEPSSLEEEENKKCAETNGATPEEEEEEEKEEEKPKDENSFTSSDGEPLMEIGTWSNDMANDIDTFSPEFENNFSQSCGMVRYGSPTSWLNNNDDDLDADSISDSMSSVDSVENPFGLRIEFKSEFLAEAVDHQIDECEDLEVHNESSWRWGVSENVDDKELAEIERFEKAVDENKCKIHASGRIYDSSKELWLKPYESNVAPTIIRMTLVAAATPPKNIEHKPLPWLLTPKTGYGLPDGLSFSGRNTDNVSDVEFKASADHLHDALAVCNLNGSSSSSSSDDDDDDDKDEEEETSSFSFDYQPELTNHVGPSPSVLLQALTMSNANDGINLERLETIGDSFLKYAITNYLYCTYENVHEGKLSHIRSKQVSNLHLYKLGKRKVFGECMIACKFEPHDNWLPPCFRIPAELEKCLIENRISTCYVNVSDLPFLWGVTAEELSFLKKSKEDLNEQEMNGTLQHLPFHLITYHSIPDKSVADCVEALIGAYLISCGIRGAMLFMSWLGIKVLPVVVSHPEGRKANDTCKVEFGYLKPPPSPLLRNVPYPENDLQQMLVGYEMFEKMLNYKFKDRSYLLQAMTHASYSPNRLTDCYQRLEFLGDAVLDYLITRHLYEDKRQHSPGALTDLRSALVNNTIFAALAIRFGFHKYFRHLSPGLADVIHRFVRIQENNNHTIFEEYYLFNEDECEEVEDVEVPKALGDIFESVAGAIFLDSGMSLDAVWNVYYRIMKNEIEQFSTNVPKSPIRELLELEPETAKFGRPEKLADGRRVRVTVEIFGKGTFKGIGRNYRIAKCTAAKCALKQLKKRGLLTKKNPSNDAQ